MGVISGWTTSEAYLVKHSYPRLTARVGSHVDYATVLRWLQEIQQTVSVNARYRESIVNHTLLMLEDSTSSLWVELLDDKKTFPPRDMVTRVRGRTWSGGTLYHLFAVGWHQRKHGCIR